MQLGYNTNGFAHHELVDALQLLAEIGYRSVAITIDHHALNPWDDRFSPQLYEVSRCLADTGLRSVIETGARYLLNAGTKHEPTLMTADATGRARRIEFLCRAVDVAAALQSDCVSLWSGILHDTLPASAAFERLVSGLKFVLEYAAEHEVRLGFEPEPGMFIDTMDQFERLTDQLGGLDLTLDVGHLHCLGEIPISNVIRRWKDRLVNVHIEDMRVGVHEHLMFGEGDMEFEPILAALDEIGYDGGVHVELSRHSHEAPLVARRSFEFLRSKS